MNTTQIWDSFKNELLGFIKSRISDDIIAEDILQDIFIKIHLKKDAITDDSKITSWVYQITRNSIIDYYRKKKLNTESLLFDVKLPEQEKESTKDFTKCLIPFIDQLNNEDKDALNKTFTGELSQKEYAQSIGLSYTATKSRIQRARQKLKNLFINCCDVETDGYGNIITENENCNCSD